MNKPWIVSHILFFPLIFLLLNASLLQFILPEYSFYDLHRILELLIFGLLAGILMFSTQSDGYLLGSYRNLPLLTQILLPLFFILGSVSTGLHPSAPTSLGPLWIASLAFLMLGILYLGGLYQRFPRIVGKSLLILMLVSAGYYLLIEWGHYAQVQYLLRTQSFLDRDEWIQKLRFPQFANPRFLDQALSWILPLIVLPALFFSKNKGLSFLLFLVSIGLWQMFWMSQSRALLLELLLAAIFIPLIFHQSKTLLRPYLKAQLLSLSLGFVLYFLLSHLVYTLPERSLSEALNERGRLDIWRFTLSLISQHPGLGVGPLNFIHYAGLFNISHPHNAFLFIAVEWGLPAGLIFLCLVLWALIRILQRAHPVSLFSIALSTSLLCGLINANFSGTLLMPVSQILLMIILGLSLGIYPLHQRNHSSLSARLTLRILIALLFFVSLRGIFPTVLTLPAQEALACESALDALHPHRCPIIPGYFANHAGFESRHPPL